jgi:release factor glutamine methyltransferase
MLPNDKPSMILEFPDRSDKRLSVKILKRVLEVFYRPWVRWYVSSKRKYVYNNIRLHIRPGVFHPGLFFSTRILLDFIAGKDLRNKKVLEPGAGSGLLSVFCATKGSRVLAIDINPEAVSGILENIQLNSALIRAGAGSVEVRTSDLFENLAPETFDLILINPPYYRGTPEDYAGHAWYCGENFEYFIKLFRGLENYTDSNSHIYMVLSGETETGTIKSIANENKFDLHCVHKTKNLLENNFIFQIKKRYGTKT